MIRCPQCGSTDLIGGRYFTVTADRTATLRCGCGEGENGIAAVRRSRRPVALEEWGRLDEDGNWTSECVEQGESAVEESVRVEVFCPTCVAAAEPGDWNERAGGTAEDRFGQSPFFACNACGAEYMIV